MPVWYETWNVRAYCQMIWSVLMKTNMCLLYQVTLGITNLAWQHIRPDYSWLGLAQLCSWHPWSLWSFVPTILARVLTVSICTTLFAIEFALFAERRPSELLTAIAVYAGVLIVFVGTTTARSWSSWFNVGRCLLRTSASDGPALRCQKWQGDAGKGKSPGRYESPHKLAYSGAFSPCYIGDVLNELRKNEYLGNRLGARFKSTNLMDDLNNQLSSYREGWSCLTAPPTTRIRLAQKAVTILV